MLADKRREEATKAVPGDLHTNTQQDKGYDPKNAFGSGGRDGRGDLWGIDVAEVDGGTHNDGGEKEAEVRDHGAGNGRLGGVGVESKHDDNAAGAGSDGKGEGIECLVLQTVYFSR